MPKRDEIEVEGDLATRQAVLRYRRGGRVLAVATVDRDRESLRIEAALEEGQATA